MKFAVLEYNSKSGGLWRHTSARPNYLADPQKEIDPTSFGCYVSALAGEHVPLTGLIVGPVNNISWPLRFYRKLYKRLSGLWPAYNIAYVLQFDALLVVHQLSDAHEMVNLLRRLRKEKKRPWLMGVATQPYGILKTALEADPAVKRNFRDFMDNCDVFISVVASTTGYYAKLTQTPVNYLPQPYPVDYASREFLPREKKEKTILVAGVTQRENVKQGQMVARALQKKFSEYTIIVPKIPEFGYDFTALQDTTYTVLPFGRWSEHLRTLARTMLVINTDYTQTRGRVQTDCAAVGTPSLGGNSDGAMALFPELASQSDTSPDALVQLGERLLTDETYYHRATSFARQALQKYDYAQSSARLQKLIRAV